MATQEEIDKLRKKLNQLKDLYQFQIDIGEDTTVVSGKIAELERVLNNFND